MIDIVDKICQILLLPFQVNIRLNRHEIMDLLKKRFSEKIAIFFD